MSEEQAEPDTVEGPLSRMVDGVKLPAVKAGQIVNEIADQAPLYGLSGAILAVGLVTGRRALARTGASMLTSQIIAALARAATDRILPAEAKAEKKMALAEPVPAEPAPAEAAPAAEAARSAERPRAAKVVTGAVLGIAAAAAGGWLLSRILKRKSSDEDEARDQARS